MLGELQLQKLRPYLFAEAQERLVISVAALFTRRNEFQSEEAYSFRLVGTKKRICRTSDEVYSSEG